VIVVSAAQVADIAARACAAYPAEACGLLVGRGRGVLRVSEVVPAANLLADTTPDRFELDPAVRFATERRVRGGPDRLIGHWHSHPEAPPCPSARDLAQAWEPHLLWLICAVRRDSGGPPRLAGLAAHRLDPRRRRFRPVPLRIAKDFACHRAPFPT